MSKKKALRVIAVRRLFLVTFAVMLGISVYLTNAQLIAGNAMPMPFGYGISVVVSGSMEPTIHVNDLVFVKQTDKLEQGDIIVYQSGSCAVIHRLVGISENGTRLARTDAAVAYGINPEFIVLTTKGDANNAEDEPITLKDVKGKYLGRVRRLGSFVSFIQSPRGISLMIALIIITLCISSVIEKKHDARELKMLEEQIRKLKEEKQKI